MHFLHIFLVGMVLCFLQVQAQFLRGGPTDAVERLGRIVYAEAHNLFWQAEQWARTVEAIPVSVREFAYLERARSLMGQGYWELALRELRTVLAHEPLSPLRLWFWKWAGIAAFMLRDYEEAQHCWDSTLALMVTTLPDSTLRQAVGQEVEYWYLLALLHRARYLQADSVAARYFQVYPASRHADEVLLFRALLAEMRHEYRQAVQLLAELRKRYPCHTATPSAISREAYLRLWLQDFASALRLTEELQLLLERFSSGGRPSWCEPLSVEELSWEEFFFVRAEAYLQRGQWEAARQEYEHLLERYPHGRLAERARLQQAWIALRTGNVEEALQRLRELRDSPNQTVKALASLYGALALKTRGDTAAARQELLELSLRPEFPYTAKVLLELGQIDYERKQYTNARLTLEQALRDATDVGTMVQILLLLGSTYQQLQQWDEALRTFRMVEQLLRQAAATVLPQRGRYEEYALLGAATTLCMLNRPAEALQILEKLTGERLAEALQPDEILFWLGEAQYRVGNFTQATQTYERLLLRYPNSPRREEALYGTAWCAFRTQQMERAVFWFERLLTEFPHTPYAAEALLRKADALYLLRQYRQAAQDYWELAKRFPSTPEGEYAAYQYGYVLYRLGEYDKAEQAFRYFVQTYPRSSLVEEGLYFLGWLAFQQQRYEESIVRFRNLLQLHPTSSLAARTWFVIGNAYYNMERWEDALTAYQMVIERFPNSLFAAEAVKSVQYCLMALGRAEEAERWLDTVKRRYPATRLEEEARLKRAELMFLRQRYDTALQEYMEFAQRYPYSERTVEALYWAFRSALALGHVEEAARISAELHRRYPKQWYTIQSTLELAREQARLNPLIADSLYRQVEHHGDSAQAAEALYQRGILAMLRGDTAVALERWRSLLQQGADTEFAAQARYQIAMYWRARQRYDSVRAILLPLVYRGGDMGAEALYYIGEAWMREGRCDSAVIAFQTLYQNHTNAEPWNPLSLLQAGECYERMNNPKAAIEVYRLVIALRPQDEYGRTAQSRLRRLSGRQP